MEAEELVFHSKVGFCPLRVPKETWRSLILPRMEVNLHLIYTNISLLSELKRSTRILKLDGYLPGFTDRQILCSYGGTVWPFALGELGQGRIRPVGLQGQ